MPKGDAIRAVLFDFYNTLLKIRTDEHDPRVWEQLARFLSYQGLVFEPATLRERFFEGIKTMQQRSGEQHPEIDMAAIFRSLFAAHGQPRKHERLAVQTAQLFRALSIRRFEAFPDTLASLASLRRHFRLGLISDAQRVFLEPEMAQIELSELFDVRVVSSDHGFRKPDPRLFQIALKTLNVTPEQAIYVGDNIYRDICGAQAAGMRAILLHRHSYQEPEAHSCVPDQVFRTLPELVEWLGGGGARSEERGA